MTCRGGLGSSCAGGESFSYDQANRLTRVSSIGESSTYTYDGDGKRLSQTTNSTTTHYVYDVNSSLPVLLSDGTNKYVWGANGLAYLVHSQPTGGEAVAVYHMDALGSVRVLTDSTGRPAQTYQTDEWGNSLPQPRQRTDQPFGFTGEQQDPSGLIYLRARMYDPLSGHFLQRDSVPHSGPGITVWNRYAYAAGNPTTEADPTGRSTCTAARFQLADTEI